MYFQKPGRNSENLEKISKKPMATLIMYKDYLCYINVKALKQSYGKDLEELKKKLTQFAIE